MTLTDRGPGIGRVRFTVDGNAVSVPRGDGSAPQQADQSVSRDDYLTLLDTVRLTAGLTGRPATTARGCQLASARTGISLRASSSAASAV